MTGVYTPNPAVEVIRRLHGISPRRQRRPARRAGNRGVEHRRLELATGPSSRKGYGLQCRGASSGTGLVEVEGRVIVYATSYVVNDAFGSFTETIHYGACAAVLANPTLDVRFLYGHEASALMPLARTGARTSLTLDDTPDGLNVTALLDPRQSAASDLIVALENGTVTQMSVGMVVDPTKDVWSGENEYGMPNVRHVYGLSDIMDVSAVTYPASPTTSIALNSKKKPGQLPVQSDPDGTNVSGPGNAPGIGNEDGTGSRSRLIDIDRDRSRLRFPPRVVREPFARCP